MPRLVALRSHYFDGKQREIGDSYDAAEQYVNFLLLSRAAAMAHPEPIIQSEAPPPESAPQLQSSPPDTPIAEPKRRNKRRDMKAEW
jgi:hypothetical protein